MQVRLMLAGAALLTSPVASPVAGANQISAKLTNHVEFGGTATFSYTGTNCHDGVFRVVPPRLDARGRTWPGVSHAPGHPRTCLITRVHVKFDGGPEVHDFTSRGTRGNIYDIVMRDGKPTVVRAG